MNATRRAFLLVAGVLAAFVVVAYAMPLFGGATFIDKDHLTQTLPSMQHLAESLRAGHVPQWWDAIDLGGAYLANPNHAALYPPAWLVAIVPMPWGADALIIAHVLFAGLGAACFAGRLGADPVGRIVAGGSFMLCGFVTSYVVFGVPMLALSWLPWIACAADRVATADDRRGRARASLWLAAAMAAGLFAGDPAYVIQGGLVALALCACRAERRLECVLWCAGAAIAAVALAAAVIVPAMLLVGDTQRPELASGAATSVWSMHPWRVLEWIWPDALGDPNVPRIHLARAVADTSGGFGQLGPALTLSVYLGLPVVLLAVVGWIRMPKRARWLGACVVAFVVLALGGFTPVYAVYRAVVAVEKLVRFPEKYLAAAFLLTCAAAGVGFTQMRDASKRTLVALAAVIGAFAALVAVFALVGRSLLAAYTSIDPDATAGHIARAGGAAVAAAIVTAGAMWWARRRPIANVVAVAAIVTPLIVGVWHWLPLVARSTITQVPAILPGDGVRDGFPTRLYRAPEDLGVDYANVEQFAIHRHQTAKPDISTRFGYAAVPSYDQAHWSRTGRAFHAAKRPVALALYGIELAFVPERAAAAEQMTPVARDDASGFVLARVADVRPRAFVATSWHWLPREDDVLAALFHARSAPVDRSIVLLGAGSDGTSTGSCAAHSPSPERVELSCDAATAAYAVLLDAWAPGWTATVDGTDAPIELADALVRAVAIPAGKHAVVFSYCTPGLLIGLAVTALAWIGLVLALFRLRRRDVVGG